MPDTQLRRTRVHGVDFSGAKDAGRKVWVASGTLGGDVLRIEDCRPAEYLAGGGRDRASCLQALVDFIEGQPDAAVGLDFPFGLPRELVKDGSWETFIAGFSRRYETAEDFKESCFQAAGGGELKRRTDRESRTPFSAYNLRLYKQTFYGIRDVLAPLIERAAARVLPMQKPDVGKPSVLEICPASTLRREGLSLSYKGRSPKHLEGRRLILQSLEPRVVVPEGIARKALDDHKGDVIDSIIAAYAAPRAPVDTTDPRADDNDYLLEGRVYV